MKFYRFGGFASCWLLFHSFLKFDTGKLSQQSQVRPRWSLTAQEAVTRKEWPPAATELSWQWQHHSSVLVGAADWKATSEGPGLPREATSQVTLPPPGSDFQDLQRKSITASHRQNHSATKPVKMKGELRFLLAFPPTATALYLIDFQFFPNIILYETCLEQWIRDCSLRVVPHLFP